MICGSSWKIRKLNEEVDPSQHHSVNTFISSDIFNHISCDDDLFVFTVFKFTFFCATSANSAQFFKNVLRENETLPAQQEMPMVKSGN